MAGTELRDSDQTAVIVLFDGVCNLCSGIVTFLIRRDKAGVFRFASLQSTAAQALLDRHGLPRGRLETVIVISGGNAYTRSDAALQIARHLPGSWRLLGALRAVPRPVRDWLYGLVARSRYRIFGKRDECMIPTPDIRQRFL